MNTDRERFSFLLESEASFWEQNLNGEDLSTTADEERGKYRTNYVGSKQKLVDWIWKHTPDGVKTVFDGFTGSAVVAYMYKTKGLQVFASDRLRFSYHMARAIIENQKTKLKPETVTRLLEKNPKAGTFVRDNFKGKYFSPEVHGRIDSIRTNIDELKGYEKDLALFALARTCMASTDHGHFGSIRPRVEKTIQAADFDKMFTEYVGRANSLVFDNGQKNQVILGDILVVLPKVEADLAYFDPPYATKFSSCNYTSAYHFLEGLMTYWEGLTLKESTLKSFESDHKAITPKTAPPFFESFLEKATHIKRWLISYRDHAFPTASEMKRMLTKLGRSANLRSKDHKYQLFNKHQTDANNPKEYLFIADSKTSTSAKAGTFLVQDEVEISVEEETELNLLTCQAGIEPIRVAGYMGNKYTMLPWIERYIPKACKTFFDAFSGGANVGYHAKRLGLAVTSNDLLRYPYHLARAVIENNSEKLTDEDVDQVLDQKTEAGTFMVDHFLGFYYTKPVLQWMENVWTNIQKLENYKKDIALAALANTVKAHSEFGQFHRTKKNQRAKATYYSQLSKHIPLDSLEGTYKRSVNRINRLVFDNGQAHKALNKDVHAALRDTQADVVYMDPPYLTEYEYNDYDSHLHFVEGLMNMWADKKLNDNAVRNYPSRTRLTREGQIQFIQQLITGAKQGFKTVLLSYRDHAFPKPEDLKGMFTTNYGAVETSSREVTYTIARRGDNGSGRNAKELLFIASDAKASRPVQSNRAMACKSQVPIELELFEPLETSASTLGQAGDPQFRCTLCRVGTNLNGDHFTREELSSRYATAINKKIDLKHSQEITDIVGGIIGSDFVDDEAGARVEVVGELYPEESKLAALAYKLMKKGIVSQVSMECDYEEGECSICGKRVASKSQYCIHLSKFKGQTWQGKPVYEVLHGVTFTGLGLLDRKGADENAKITQVASSIESNTVKGESMSDPKEKTESSDMEGEEKGEQSPPKSDKDVEALREENSQLKARIVELTKQIEKLEAEKKAAANRSRAEKLISRFLEKGVVFATPEARSKELERLAGLSDEAFAATEASVGLMPFLKTKEEKAEKKPEGSSSLDSSAALRPLDVDDAPTSLEEQLSQGFMVAYQERQDLY